MLAQTSRLAGQLQLTIAQRQGRSVATAQYHQGALRILRPHYLDHGSQVTYTLINPGGAYFGADRYQLSLKVETAAALGLTTQSATKVYKTPQGPAVQEMEVDLACNSAFEYLPDQLIVYRGGSYRQRTRVRMRPSSCLTLAEVITPGWSPQGQEFAYRAISARTEILVLDEAGKERRLALDQIRLHPAAGTSLQSLGLLENYSHTGQLFFAAAAVDQSLIDQLRQLLEEPDTYSGLSTTLSVAGVQGITVRTLGQTTQAVVRVQHRLINCFRAKTRGLGQLNVRK